MDLYNLDSFFHYVPFLDKDPQIIVDEIKTDAGVYLDEESVLQIQKTYEFAQKAHEGQKRLTGEEYITHPLFATKYLMKINPDLASIQACILHDVIEDTSFTYEDLKNRFGEEIAEICYGLEKVGKVRYEGEDRQLETLKKTFLAMGKDLRVIFIKFADRIHNIQTLKFHPKVHKRHRIADETLKIFVPIAQRLGLAVFQTYLENGAFAVLNEGEFKRIFRYIKRKYGTGRNYIRKGKSYIENILKNENIKFDNISGRFKSPYRIFKKLQKYQTDDISKVMDILAFRIITYEVSDCYNIMGTVHKYYTPIIKKIKDYIAVPKSNGYKSIHTTILGMFVFPVELQIRTDKMDYVAQYGVAAHYAYKEFGEDKSISSSQSKWIKRLQDVVNDFQKKENRKDFKDTLQIEVLDKDIFVYTPQGDIIELPKNSTVLDFAFKIHTDIGLKFKNAIVNNRIVPKDYKPNNGDFVRIQTFRNKYTASSGRFQSLHTPSAKAKLGRFLRFKEKERYVEFGIDELNKKLKLLSLPLIDGKGDKISKVYKGEERDRMFMEVGNKQKYPNKIIKEVYGDEILEKHRQNFEKDYEKEKKISQERHSLKELKSNLGGEVIIDTDKRINYFLCPECDPKPGDKIIAKSGKNGIKIHKLSCKGLSNISYDRFLEAHWSGEEVNVYYIKLKLELQDKPGVLLSILNIFYDLDINIGDLLTRTTAGENTYIEIILSFYNPSKMYFVLKELRTYKNVVKKIAKEIIDQ